MPSMNLEKRDLYYTSPYRSFNFQQLFFYDIFLRNAYFALRVIGRQSILYDSQLIFFTDFLA